MSSTQYVLGRAHVFPPLFCHPASTRHWSGLLCNVAWLFTHHAEYAQCTLLFRYKIMQCSLIIKYVTRNDCRVVFWPKLTHSAAQSLCDSCITYYYYYYPSSARGASARQHPSYGDCLEVKREYYQNCFVLGCVTQCLQSSAHTYMSSFYRSSRLGLSHWDPYAMCRGGCLELYYFNMVEWSWWDSSLIWKTN